MATRSHFSSAIEPARSYLHYARKLLPEDWYLDDNNSATAFEILLLLAECEYVCGAHAIAHKLFEELLEKGKDTNAKARVGIF